MKLKALQSFALWAISSTAVLQVLTANGEGKHIEALVVTVLAVWPLWLLWRMSCFLWKCASILSMAVSTKHQRMKSQRDSKYFHEVY
jgi:hypothetical protein